jgi:hypothetical protein
MYETKVATSALLLPNHKLDDPSAWAKEKGMRTFLSVAQGTHEPAKFLEMYVSFLYTLCDRFSLTRS